MRKALAARILQFGATALTDDELTVAVLGRCVAVDRYVLARADPDELLGTGVAPEAVARLVAVVELGRRLLAPLGDAIVVDRPAVVYELLRPRLVAEEREHLVVVSVDRRRRMVAVDTVSTGSPGFTIVDAPTIFRTALRRGAHAVVLAHNHPSGDPTPSREDVEVTRRVSAASRVIGIPLLDHVVVARNGHASIAECGSLPAINGLAMVAS